jgi:hypothetical protein
MKLNKRFITTTKWQLISAQWQRLGQYKSKCNYRPERATKLKTINYGTIIIKTVRTYYLSYKKPISQNS